MLARWRTVFRQVAAIVVLTALMSGWNVDDARAGVSTDLTVTVSLEANPDPDDEDRYEAILEDFAAAVFDASEGAHRIGTIRVYRNAARHDTADIVWQLQGRPQASLNGFRSSGSDPGQMYMANVFTGAGSDGSDVPLVDEDDIADHPDAELESAGALLAHEWAHYAYGLLDEHVIAGGDIAVLSSLMNSPWTAATDAGWRNFSVNLDGMPPFEPYEDTRATAHHRAYARSAWELIGRTPAAGAELVSPIPGRIEREDYPELRGLPTGALPVSQILASPPTIEWVDPCSRYAIAIDNSGSMAGVPLATAKDIADLIILFIPADSAELSLVSFGETQSQMRRRFVNEIVNDDRVGGTTQRERLRTLLSTVTSVAEATSFLTGLDEAAQVLGTPSCPNGDQPTTALFFLSDGTNTPGEDLDAAIDTLAMNGIRIFAIDVSEFIPGEATNTMTPLVARTGGVLIGPNNIAGFSEARQAFDQAQAPNRTEHLLARAQGVLLPDAGSSNLFQFTVDPTLDRFDLCARASGPIDTLALSGPSSLSLPLAFRQTDPMEPDDDCSFFWAQNGPNAGVWTVSAGAASTSGVTLDFEVRAQSSGASINLRGWISNATTPVVYPEPIHVTATLAEDRPIIGARIEATRDGGPPIQLRDDGRPPDAFRNDGIYVGSFVYDADCDPTTSSCNRIELHADEVGPGVALSSEGLVRAPGVTGNVLSAEAAETIGSAFDRILELDGPATTGCCSEATMVPADNTGINGRITANGEVDVFTVDASALSGPGEVRVSGALLGMQPRLRVLAGGNVLGDETAGPGVAGVTVPVDFDMQTLTVEVQNAAGGTGTYQVSAGTPLGLVFGAGGSAESPCEIAARNKTDAISELGSGLAGVATASTLITESRSLERQMEAGIRALSDPSSRQKKAKKLLRKAAGRDKKALKKLRRAARRERNEEIEGAKRKIRNAAKKLSKACRRLSDGGVSLVP